MALYDFRRHPRRLSMTRRSDDRRKITYPFGSPEWQKNMERFYLAWPITNRRAQSRRENERRAPERRRQQISEQAQSEKKYSRLLLSQEERELIDQLYVSDRGK